LLLELDQQETTQQLQITRPNILRSLESFEDLHITTFQTDLMKSLDIAALSRNSITTADNNT
jgi:hypothetical protein